MFENITPEHSAALDVIIRARHSVRAFSPIPPSQEAIEAIIQAGLLAPFAALAVAGKPDFRKVFVIRNSEYLSGSNTFKDLYYFSRRHLGMNRAEKVNVIPIHS